MQMSLDDPIHLLPNIGLKRAEIFNSIGIRTVKDLLFFFPHKHLDRRNIVDSEKLAHYLATGYEGEVTIVAKVYSNDLLRYGKKHVLKVTMKDEKGFFDLVWFNGIEYLKNKFIENEFYAVSGKPVFTKYNHIQIAHPDFDKLENAETNDYMHTGKIIPFYKIPEKLRKYKLGDFSLRKLMSYVVEKYSPLLKDSLPKNIVESNNLIDLTTSVRNYHFPIDHELFSQALYRIKFEELFFLELIIGIKKNRFNELINGNKLKIDPVVIKKFLSSLPFELTKSQLKVLSEIRKDFESGKALNRLLQGDVGSGKTIVAFICILIASSNNYQSVITVPTEVLARQHFNNLKKYFNDFNKNIFLFIGGLSPRDRLEKLEEINSTKNSIIIGTHALFEEDITLKNLGLIIIDEQHKFGVLQRSKIIKKGISPHVLIMSATPIPRTLSMTLYGDLDVSTINEMPMNRKPIKTLLRTENDLNNIYNFIKSRIDQHEQAFIVYPIIDESINLNLNLKSAELYFDKLSKDIFNEYKVQLLHGRMSTNDKETIMNRLKKKEIDILISTTVIEVGIDIPDATIMLINNPERFGLSQLHQLRGRVGRGDKQSYCILVVNKNFDSKIPDENYSFEFMSQQQVEKNKTAIRLKSFEQTLDGFKLAELDLQLRGPGDIFGTKQSGLPELKYASLPNDFEILIKAREAAFTLISSDPLLIDSDNENIKKKLAIILASHSSPILIS